MPSNPAIRLCQVMLAVSLLGGCVAPPVRQGDFTMSQSLASPKGMLTLTSPQFRTADRGRYRFEVVNLPSAIDPLEFSLGSINNNKATGDEKIATRSGRMVVQAFGGRDRKSLGQAIRDDKGLQVIRTGKSQRLKDFLLVVTIEEPFGPEQAAEILYSVNP